MLTVVVPVYRQWMLVEALLDCLEHQTLSSAKFRVVLINNEPGFSVSAHIIERATVIECAVPGAYAARNQAVEIFMAATDWFVFTDADCLPEPEWLEQLDMAMTSYKQPCVLSGDVMMVASRANPGWNEIYDLVRGIPQREYAALGFGATANLAIPAEVFHCIGTFDTRTFSGGDRLFCLKAAQYGFPLHYQATARVLHPARTRYVEIAQKARRIRGAQIAQSQGSERLLRVLYSLGPPVLPISRLLRRHDQKAGHRLIASLVQCRIWMEEIPEVFRALRGHTLERG